MDTSNEPPEGNAATPRRMRGMASNVPQANTTLVVRNGKESISVELALTIFRHMVRARILEERSIKMSKSGEAYFWIGGPGEEAFNTCLGMLTRKGAGPAFDYLHLHYRNSSTMLALGMPMVDHFRQLAMTKTDPNSRGRNFVGHYARAEWNVIPVTSVIEVQYLMAPGTALMQKRTGAQAISIVCGGDAGTAEGDFASGLIWSSRPGQELPVLMIVTNNRFGISTPYETQQSVRRIADRAAPHGIAHDVVDGNNPVASWHALDRAMHYVRTQQKPYLLEAMVSRLHGHSSSSGAKRHFHEVDCVQQFEQLLVDCAAIDAEGVRQLKAEAQAEAEEAVALAVQEEKPTAADVEWGTYAPSSVDEIYPGDYDGLPQAKAANPR